MTFRPPAIRIPSPLKYAVALLALLLPLAWILHAYSELPSSYSWFRTLQWFSLAITDKYFMVMAFIVLLAERLNSENSPRSFLKESRAKSYDMLRTQSRWFVSLAMYRPSLERAQFMQGISNGLSKKNLPYIVAVIFSVGPLLTLAFISSSYTKWDLLFLPVVAAMLFRILCKRHIGYALLALIASVSLFMTVSYVFTIIKSQLFVSGNVLDAQIVAAEKAVFGYPLHTEIAQWAASHMKIVRFSDWVYYLFFHHIVLVALFLFALGDRREQLRYLTCLSLCYLLGGGLYYFYPAWGPAYYAPADFGYLREGAPQTVFFQEMLWKATQESIQGSLAKIEPYAFIACMPSLHMAHETIMLFYSRRSSMMLLFSGLFWLSSFVAVLVLGWHYFFDVIGGGIFAGVIIAFAQLYKNVNRRLPTNDQSG
jgi:hypothetical protein